MVGDVKIVEDGWGRNDGVMKIFEWERFEVFGLEMVE